MEPTDLLQLIVEASLALAGFAGIVVAIAKGGAAQLGPIQRLNMVNLLATAFVALGISLMALVMISAQMTAAVTWGAASVLGTAAIVYFGWRSMRLVVRTVGVNSRNIVTVLLINVPLAAVCVVQVLNLLGRAQFWPVFLLLSALFGLGCYSFVRLLFAKAEG